MMSAGGIAQGISGILLLIGGVVAAIVCAAIASAKGRSALLFGVLGLFFSLFTLAAVLILPSKRRA